MTQGKTRDAAVGQTTDWGASISVDAVPTGVSVDSPDKYLAIG